MKKMVEQDLVSQVEYEHVEVELKEQEQAGRWKAYAEYKGSGVEWLGETPEHWEVKKIKRLSLVKRGASPRPIDDPLYFDENGEYAWVRISDVTASNKHLHETEQRLSLLGASKSVKLGPGELFLSIAGSVGKPIITAIKCCIHDGFVYFVGLQANREFLCYIFSCGEVYKGLGKLGTQLNLNTDTIGDIKIPIPSMDEQNVIVTFLNQRVARINDLIAKKEQHIALLQEQRTAIINQAVTKGLNANVPMKDSGIEWLGEIPEGWEVRRVKSVATILRGKFSHRPRNDPRFYDGPYPFIQTGDITSAQKYITTYQQTLNELGYQVSKEFPSQTLVMTIAANVGDVAILTFSACFPDSMVGFVPRQSTFLDYLYYCFIAMNQEMLSTATINTQLNLNIERIGGLYTVYPPLEEQKAIAAYLEQETTKIDKLITGIQESTKKLKEYSTALISAAVTGKIDVRGEVAAGSVEDATI